MNEKLKKVNSHFLKRFVGSKRNEWRLFALGLYSFLFGALLYGMGGALWIQAFLLSALIFASMHILFYFCVCCFFKGRLLKGAQGGPPANFKALLKESPSQWEMVSGPGLIFFSFDFYSIKKTWLSLPLLKRMEGPEIPLMIKRENVYFQSGAARFFTQFCFILFWFLGPLHLALWLLKKGGFVRMAKGLSALMYFILAPLFFVFSFWLRRRFIEVDAALGNDPLEWERLRRMEAFLSADPPLAPPLMLPLFGFHPGGPFRIHPPLEYRKKWSRALKRS